MRIEVITVGFEPGNKQATETTTSRASGFFNEEKTTMKGSIVEIINRYVSGDTDSNGAYRAMHTAGLDADDIPLYVDAVPGHDIVDFLFGYGDYTPPAGITADTKVEEPADEYKPDPVVDAAPEALPTIEGDVPEGFVSAFMAAFDDHEVGAIGVDEFCEIVFAAANTHIKPVSVIMTDEPVNDVREHDDFGDNGQAILSPYMPKAWQFMRECMDGKNKTHDECVLAGYGKGVKFFGDFDAAVSDSQLETVRFALMKLERGKVWRGLRDAYPAWVENHPVLDDALKSMVYGQAWILVAMFKAFMPAWDKENKS